MTIRLNGALSRCLAGSALGGLMAFSFVPTAMAQWLPPPWGAAFPSDIARSLEARGYVLTAPLMRRPGVYLADVSGGPAGYQRLIVDARSGQILERFTAPGRMWGPVLASRGDEFGEPAPPRVGGPPPGGAFSNPPGGSPPAKSAYGGSGNVHIPAAISPYGPAAAPLSTKPKSKVASIERKIPGRRRGSPIRRSRLPPHAKRPGRTNRARQRPTRRRTRIWASPVSDLIRQKPRTLHQPPRPRRKALPLRRATNRR